MVPFVWHSGIVGAAIACGADSIVSADCSVHSHFSAICDAAADLLPRVWRCLLAAAAMTAFLCSLRPRLGPRRVRAGSEPVGRSSSPAAAAPPSIQASCSAYGSPAAGRTGPRRTCSSSSNESRTGPRRRQPASHAHQVRRIPLEATAPPSPVTAAVAAIRVEGAVVVGRINRPDSDR